jgi:hypothetical protein
MLIGEVEVTDHGKAGVLAGPVHRRRRLRIQHAGGDGVERLENPDDGSGGEGLDLEAATGGRADPLAEVLERLVGGLGGAPHGLGTPADLGLRSDDGGCPDRRSNCGGCDEAASRDVA